MSDFSLALPFGFFFFSRGFEIATKVIHSNNLSPHQIGACVKSSSLNAFSLLFHFLSNGESKTSGQGK